MNSNSKQNKPGKQKYLTLEEVLKRTMSIDEYMESMKIKERLKIIPELRKDLQEIMTYLKSLTPEQKAELFRKIEKTKKEKPYKGKVVERASWIDFVERMFKKR